MTGERKYVSDTESYEVFVGQLTPEEFISPYNYLEDPINAAIADFIDNFPHDEPVPSWLKNSLYRYVESRLE